MNSLSNKKKHLLLCLLEILVGILLLIDPIGFTSIIFLAFGIFLLLMGLFRLIQYLRSKNLGTVDRRKFVSSLFFLILGGFLVIFRSWLLSALPFFSVFYGIIILFTGLSKIRPAIAMAHTRRQLWYLGIISAVVSILCGVIILFNPFTSNILWIFTGISLIFESVLDLITLMTSWKDHQ